MVVKGGEGSSAGHVYRGWGRVRVSVGSVKGLLLVRTLLWRWARHEGGSNGNVAQPAGLVKGLKHLLIG